jgi:hypothetical protein
VCRARAARLCDLTIFDLSRIRARRSSKALHALGLYVKKVQQQPKLYQRYVDQQIRRNPLVPAARRSSTSAACALAARPLLSAHPAAPALATDKPRNNAHSLPNLLAASQLARRAGAIRSNRQLRPHSRTARPSAHPRLVSTRTRCAKSEKRVTSRSSSARNSPAQRTPHRRVHEVAPAGHKDAVRQRLRHQKEEAAVDRYILSCIAHLIRADIPEAIGVLAGIHTSYLMQPPITERSPTCGLQKL